MTTKCTELLNVTDPNRLPKATDWTLAPAPERFTEPNLVFKLDSDIPGFAEIKPFNQKGLNEGWADLGKKKGTGRDRAAKFLVVYLPVKEGKTGEIRTDTVTLGVPPCVRVFAIPYTGERKRPALEKLTFHDLGYFKPEDVAPLNVEQPALFGVAIEKYVRTLFKQKILDKMTPSVKKVKGGEEAHGADIYWDELARFYAELAQELSDPFYAELAAELASLSREAAMWDAA